jgi:disulfide bond formation protein DsbB
VTRIFEDWRILAALAATGSAALLVGALWFQHLGGLAPCPLCLWQRWPHAIVIGLGVAALLLRRWRGAAVLLAAAALV